MYCKLLKNVPVHTHLLTRSCTVHSYTFTHVLYKRKTLTKVPCKHLCTVNTYRLISTHSSTVQLYSRLCAVHIPLLYSVHTTTPLFSNFFTLLDFYTKNIYYFF